MTCDHRFAFQAVVYWEGTPPTHKLGFVLAPMMYADRYYCVKCLRVEDRNECIRGIAAQPPLAGALPRTAPAP